MAKTAVVFAGEVNALANNTLVSKRISSPFTVTHVTVSFPLNQNREVDVKIFISPDSNVETATDPQGFNILQEYGQVDYLHGDGEQLNVPVHVPFRQSGAYLKMYMVNNDNFKHKIFGIVTIETHQKGV